MDIEKFAQIAMGRAPIGMSVEDFLEITTFEAEYFTNENKEQSLEGFYLSTRPIILSHDLAQQDGTYKIQGEVITSLYSYGIKLSQWTEPNVYVMIGYNLANGKCHTEKLDISSRKIWSILKNYKICEIKNFRDVEKLFSYVCFRLNQVIQETLPEEYKEKQNAVTEEKTEETPDVGYKVEDGILNVAMSSEAIAESQNQSESTVAEKNEEIKDGNQEQQDA